MRRIIAGNRLKRAMALVLAAGMALSAAGVSASAAGSETGGDATYDAGYVSERISNSYSKVSAKYKYKEYTGEDVLLPLADAANGSSHLTADTRDYPHGAQVLDLTVDDVVELAISVPADGLYQLAFDYLSYDDSVLPVEFAMQIDGTIPQWSQ